MKKFFELSVTSRKSVDGNVALSAITATEENNELGRLDIKLLNKETHGGIFFKYTPVEGSNPDDVIAKVKLTGRDPSEIEAALTAVRSGIQETLFSINDKSFAEKLVLAAMVGMYIQPEAEMILIPTSSGVKVTNNIISKVVSDEWLGVEIKLNSEVQEKIANLADAKRKDPEYVKRYHDTLKKMTGNGESSHTEE